jgi:glucose-1-phosphate thymidylyltransferase
MIGAIEEIAWKNNWITDSELEKQGKKLENSPYGKYLLKILWDR